MKKTALFSKAVLIFYIMVFWGCATINPDLGPAPEFNYKIDDANAPESVKPFMTLFEGMWRWRGYGPYWKFVITKVDGNDAEVMFSWSDYIIPGGERRMEGVEYITNAEFDAEKMEISWGAAIRSYMTLINDNGELTIKGNKVRWKAVDHITMKPATRE
jgi:hypothetical protein